MITEKGYLDGCRSVSLTVHSSSLVATSDPSMLSNSLNRVVTDSEPNICFLPVPAAQPKVVTRESVAGHEAVLVA